MITGRSSIRALVLPVAIAAAAHSQAQDRKEAAPFPHPVALEVSLDRSTFETREPVIAQVTLTNRGRHSFRIRVREDGAPYGIALHVSGEEASVRKHSLWIGRHGPQPRDIVLAGGESTTGEILVLLDYGKEYVFSDPGPYTIVWRWYPGRGFAMMYTSEARVRVVRASRVNEDFLEQLEVIALRYHVGESADNLDLSTPEAEKGMDREGVLLLSKIISQQKPHLVDPERRPADEREAELVDALTDLLNHHPDSSYSGYIARFLGLVHIKTFERSFTAARSKAWKETGKYPNWDSSTFRADPSYQKALHYLTLAHKAQVWPRTIAIQHLAALHGLSRDWDKAAASCETLRSKYADIGGARLADELEEDILRHRAKVERRKRGSGSE